MRMHLPSPSRYAVFLPVACVLCLTTTLTSCAGAQGAYPSLARTKAERESSAAAVQNAPDTAASATLGSGLQTEAGAAASGLGVIMARFEAAARNFEGELAGGKAAIAAARGLSPQDKAYGKALIALAVIDTKLSAARTSANELGDIYATAALNGGAPLEVLAAHEGAITKLTEMEDSFRAQQQLLAR